MPVVTAPAPEQTAQIPLPSNSTCGLPDFGREILALINEARATARTCGTTHYAAAAPLGWDMQLFQAAATHAADMAANNYFSHTGQDGSSFSDRLSAAGYRYRAAAENIAAGQTSVRAVMQGWIQSPGHCANIMNGNLTEVAVACVRSNGNAQYGTYWAMELGRPM